MIRDDYLERVYSGFLGMNIGIRLGAPVEPSIWTYERIRDTYGDITDYVKDYKNFAADDDANGPVFFLRALYDDAVDRPPVPEDVARAWLNYTREGKGMFWWGGYGVSTEHTAYLNLKARIPAPVSGSAAQNGKTLSEQIGGQIFVDTWGLINPGNPERAAEYGEAAARVSHDGEGVIGARFICACIAAAFEEKTVEDIIDRALSLIPEDSVYAGVVGAVRDFFDSGNGDFRDCFEQVLLKDWGYDRYGGVCHIIPNAGVCALALLYGGGDFARSIEIATMCGWDTDCNAGNVGTILGVFAGIENIPARYRKPVNDGIVLSGISGYLNILDIPTYANELAALGYRLEGRQIPEDIERATVRGEIHYNFDLPGSTHNMRLSDPLFCSMSHSTEKYLTGHGALKIVFDHMVRGDRCKLYYKPFYRRDEFSDERYSPVFSPTVYPGQTVSMKIYMDQWNGWEEMGFAPYVRTMSDKADHLQGYQRFTQDDWVDISFAVPDVGGDVIDEVGIVIEAYAPSKSKSFGVLYLDSFDVNGGYDYDISFAKMRCELATVTPFSTDHGAWTIEDGKLSQMRNTESFAYSGNYYGTDYEVSTTARMEAGDGVMVLGRAQGAMRFYAGGLEDGKAVIIKNDFGYSTLAQTEYAYTPGEEYSLSMSFVGDMIALYINGAKVLEVEDRSFGYGMFGCGSRKLGRTLFGDFSVKSIE